jgi:hypothetical protein
LVTDGACDSAVISDNKLGNVRESTQSGRGTTTATGLKGYYVPPVRITSGYNPDEKRRPDWKTRAPGSIVPGWSINSVLGSLRSR